MYNDYNDQNRSDYEYHYSYRSDSDGFQPQQVGSWLPIETHILHTKHHPHRQRRRHIPGQVRGQRGGDSVPGFPDPGGAKIDSDGVKSGLRAAQHHRRYPAYIGVRPMGCHQLTSNGQRAEVLHKLYSDCL